MLTGTGATGRAIVLPTILVLGALILYPLVFPEGYNAFVTRWSSAYASESQYSQLGIFARALYGFVDFSNLMGDAPIIGYGLGLAGNASLTLGVNIPGFHGWAENDWARHIVDLGPLMGVAYIAYRVAFVAWLGLTCVTSTRRNGDPLAFLLYAFVSVELLSGQITGHGTVNGYGWLFAGLCLAVSRTGTSSLEQTSTAEPQVRLPRYANLLR
jgi:hypothetical protein